MPNCLCAKLISGFWSPVSHTTWLKTNALQVMEFNKRVQFQNKSPKDFPTFVRDQFNIDIVAPGYTEDADGVPP